jgi:hypothetical protein
VIRRERSLPLRRKIRKRGRPQRTQRLRKRQRLRVLLRGEHRERLKKRRRRSQQSKGMRARRRSKNQLRRKHQLSEHLQSTVKRRKKLQRSRVQWEWARQPQLKWMIAADLRSKTARNMNWKTMKRSRLLKRGLKGTTTTYR